MQLTTEQQEQIQRAKAAGETRITLPQSPEQVKNWRAAADKEMDGKAENIAHLRKFQVAASQPGFFGDVRRAIALARRPTNELAEQIGVDPRLLSDFRAGDAELSPACLDRLIEVLGLRLMQEIPR